MILVAGVHARAAIQKQRCRLHIAREVKRRAGIQALRVSEGRVRFEQMSQALHASQSGSDVRRERRPPFNQKHSDIRVHAKRVHTSRPPLADGFEIGPAAEKVLCLGDRARVHYGGPGIGCVQEIRMVAQQRFDRVEA